MTLTVTTRSREHSVLGGMSLAAIAFALLTSVDTIFKFIALDHYPAHQILFINACFALMPILVWTKATGGFGQLRTGRLWQHLARGGTSVLAAFAAIYAYSRLPLTNYYAIIFTGPLIVTILSVFWLGEKIDRRCGLAIGLGLFGVMIVTRLFDGGEWNVGPEGTEGRLAALLSVLCYAASVVTIRRMRLGEGNLTFSFYGYMAAFMIGGALYLLWGGASLSVTTVLHLALSGTLAGIASICLMTAYHRTPVALVAPFQYTQIIWGALAGYLLWQQVPDFHLIVGAVIVAASGLYVIFHEMKFRSA